MGKHQRLHVLPWDDDTLASRQTAAQAGVVEAGDLLVDAAYRLEEPHLVDRPGDRDVLPDRQLADRGQQRVQLRGRCAVSVDLAVVLLEADACVYREGEVHRVGLPQVAFQNEDALVMYLAREPGLVLDVDDPLASGSYRCGYHGGGAERRQPAVHDRKTVHDPGLHPVNRDQEVA